MPGQVSLNESVNTAIGSNQWVDSCYDTMRELAQEGKPFCASDFFSDELSEATCVDLIYAEYILREASQDFNLEQFISRYSRFEKALRRQLDFDCAFSETTDDPASRMASLGVPEFIGKFQVLEALSAGSQASVYRALHPDLKCDVVIKHYKKFPGRVADFDQALREGQCLASLNHPALSQIMDVGVHEDSPFLVTRLIRGDTLQAFAIANRPDYSLACRIVGQIADAISQAHTRGILHLDLKPSNVVMDSDANPHVIDFGLAAYRQPYKWDHLPEGSIRGTLLYMSPEQAQGDSNSIDHQSDIFSLGAMLYFLCVGTPPYAHTRSLESLTQIQNGNWLRAPLDESSMPARLKQVIVRALAVDKRERFNSAGELAEELQQILAEPAHSPWVTRRSAALMVTVACAAMLAVVGAMWRNMIVPVCQAQPQLEIRVLRDGTYHSLTECAPVRTGEHLRIVAQVPAGHYAALYAHQSDGKFRQLASKAAANRDSTIAYPEAANESVPMVGESGTEMIIVCLSHEPIDEASEPVPVQLPAIADLAVLSTDELKTTILQQTRDVGSPVKNNQGLDLQSLMEEYREKMASKVDHFHSLAFAHIAE